MKISIVGLGKMGSLVQKTAQEENIEIASSIDPHQKDADFSEIDEKSLHGTDVCICFTQPTAALENIEKIASFKKKLTPDRKIRGVNHCGLMLLDDFFCLL